MAEENGTRMCLYCGNETPHHLGVCKFCGVGVCEKCGNIQLSFGDRFPAHDECIGRGEYAFTMIKFVK